MTAKTKPSPESDAEESPKTNRIPRWVGAIATVALAVGIVGGVLFYGYQAKPGWVGVAGKKFWDYLELLIVPAALAIGVYLLNRAQREREFEDQEAQQEREREAQAAQRERELEVENRRAQDAALQTYLAQMSQLLTDKERPLRRAQPGDSLSTVARALTLTVLPRLDGERKRSVLQFLHESELINKNHLVVDIQGADLSNALLVVAHLEEANLRHTNLDDALLSHAYLNGANLAETNLRQVNLDNAYLRHATLTWADLEGSSLTSVKMEGAMLIRAGLSGTDLRAAKLRGADLRGAELGNADLRWADLRQAVLRHTDLRGANLYGADLRGAEVSEELLAQRVRHLERATLPNGKKYEEWLKHREYCGESLTIREKDYLSWLRDKEGHAEDLENNDP